MEAAQPIRRLKSQTRNYFLQVSDPIRQSIKNVKQYSEMAKVERQRYAHNCVPVQ